MKRRILVVALFFLSANVFAQAEREVDIVDVQSTNYGGSYLLGDGRWYEFALSIDYSEKDDATFGDDFADDPCPARGKCAYVFEQSFEDGDDTFETFTGSESILQNSDYTLKGLQSAEVTYPSVLLGETVNAQWVGVGPVDKNTFRNTSPPPDNNNEFLNVINDAGQARLASVTAVGLDSGLVLQGDGFLARGHYRELGIILPEN